jgi:GntR family transcriptional regulator
MTARRRKTFEFRLDSHSGVPVYRQLMDQVNGALASGVLLPGDRLPTVRQVAVDLSINPNTVIRAYRELEIRGILDSQQGTGTFIRKGESKPDEADRQRQLDQIITDVVARAGAAGFTVGDLLQELKQRQSTRGERI